MVMENQDFALIFELSLSLGAVATVASLVQMNLIREIEDDTFFLKDSFSKKKNLSNNDSNLSTKDFLFLLQCNPTTLV